MFVFAAVIAGAYATGVRRSTRLGRSWRTGRTVAATGAVVAISIAGVVPDRTFTGHMAEHVLVGMVGPVLLALAAPLTLALQTGSPTVRSTLRRALRSRPVIALSHPVVGFALFGTTTVWLYLTPLLELTARDPWHALVHVHLLVVGCLFVWPLVGTDRQPRPTPPGARLLVVLLAVPFHAFLGLALLSSSRPVAPDAYPDLADQHRAAGLLWVAGELLTLTVATIVWRAWFESDRREAIRLDRRLDGRGVENTSSPVSS